MVGDPDPDAGIPLPEALQYRQQQAPQGGLAGADGDEALAQLLLQGQLPLGCLQMLHRRGYVAQQQFSLGGQGHTPAGPEEQGAAQLLLQQPNGSGDVGLAQIQGLGGLGDVLAIGDKVKNPVVIVADIHRIHHIKKE